MRDSKGRFCKALKVGDVVDAQSIFGDTCTRGVVASSMPYSIFGQWNGHGEMSSKWCYEDDVKLHKDDETKEIYSEPTEQSSKPELTPVLKVGDRVDAYCSHWGECINGEVVEIVNEVYCCVRGNWTKDNIGKRSVTCLIKNVKVHVEDPNQENSTKPSLKVGDSVTATFCSLSGDAHTCTDGLIVAVDEHDPKYPYRIEADWFGSGIRYALWCINKNVKLNISETDDIHSDTGFHDRLKKSLEQAQNGQTKTMEEVKKVLDIIADGSVVRLKSGGPSMVVEHIEEGLASVAFISGGIFRTALVNLVALEVVK